MANIFRIHAHDNVAVAIADIPKGTPVQIEGQTIIAQEKIPAGHKISLRTLAKGEDVIKYGFPIGKTTVAVPAGTWMHTHNVKSRLGNLLSYTYHPEEAPAWHAADYASQKDKKFLGYARPEGTVGIRNELWIIPTVGCVNAIAQEIAKRAQTFLPLQNIDGVFAYAHPYGCSQLGDDLHHTQDFLASLVHHPNAAGVLVLGLGCENNEMGQMQARIGNVDARRVKYLVCQDVEDEIAEGVRLVQELCQYATQLQRTEQPVSKLIIGLKCGGSDGFSGITANPLVGMISNLLIAAGGTGILTEVPEMFGAETLLMNRCRDVATFEKTVQLINDFKAYFMSHGEKINENPSPGNKAGGITTLEDKSLGCVQKGGIAPVMDVLSYGQRATEKGLLLLQAPGNDLVAADALAAAGAHMVLFTTGRGTPFSSPVPTIKIASNPQLASFKSRWIDYNAGKLLQGVSMQQASEELFTFLLQLASGKAQAKSEALDKRELAIFKDGVTL